MNKRYLNFFFLFLMPALLANPKDPTVISGHAFIKNIDQKTVEIHTSQTTIIHWNDFSIHPEELTKFVMPSATSAVLNRVVGEQMSSLQGLLQSNGKVYLINPNGVVIGKDAVINTASFVASTFDVLNEDFLKNRELLFRGDSQASVINYGTVEAWDGDVLLIGRFVKNEGVLSAPNGNQAALIGEEILLKPSKSKNIYILPEKNSESETFFEELKYVQEELKNEGNPYALAINQNKINEGTVLEERQGRIFLVSEKSKTSDATTFTVNSQSKPFGQGINFTNQTKVNLSQDPITLVITPPRIPAFQNRYGIAISEALRDLSTYDDFLFSNVDFGIYYDRKSYRLECYPKEQLSSYDLISDQVYNALKQKYLNYNTKYTKSLF